MLNEESLLDSGLWVESACNYTEGWVNLKEFMRQTHDRLRAFWGKVEQDRAA
jgi:hypothetical protein